jgi:hypothetical protein
VVYALTNSIRHLADEPSALAHLADDPSRIPVAIEEFLRFMTPITHLGRTATCDVSVGDRALQTGDLVSLCFASANRDEAAFEHADQLRLDRRPNRHVAFGHGPHTCVGAPMARHVLRIALEQLVARCAILVLVEAVAHDEGIRQEHLNLAGRVGCEDGMKRERLCSLQQRPMVTDEYTVYAPPSHNRPILLESAVEPSTPSNVPEATASEHQLTPLDVMMIVIAGVGIGTAIALLFN